MRNTSSTMTCVCVRGRTRRDGSSSQQVNWFQHKLHITRECVWAWRDSTNRIRTIKGEKKAMHASRSDQKIHWRCDFFLFCFVFLPARCGLWPVKRSSAGASKVQPTGQTKSPKMYFLYKLEIATFPISLLVSPFIQHYGGVGARHHPKKHSEAVIERMACLPQSVRIQERRVGQVKALWIFSKVIAGTGTLGNGDRIRLPESGDRQVRNRQGRATNWQRCTRSLWL